MVTIGHDGNKEVVLIPWGKVESITYGVRTYYNWTEIEDNYDETRKELGGCILDWCPYWVKIETAKKIYHFELDNFESLKDIKDGIVFSTFNIDIISN